MSQDFIKDKDFRRVVNQEYFFFLFFSLFCPEKLAQFSLKNVHRTLCAFTREIKMKIYSLNGKASCCWLREKLFFLTKLSYELVSQSHPCNLH